MDREINFEGGALPSRQDRTPGAQDAAPHGLLADLLNFEEFPVEKAGSKLETVDSVENYII